MHRITSTPRPINSATLFMAFPQRPGKSVCCTSSSDTQTAECCHQCLRGPTLQHASHRGSIYAPDAVSDANGITFCGTTLGPTSSEGGGVEVTILRI